MKKKQIKSFYPKKETISESWVVYDARRSAGRAASDISSLVLGKYSASYTPGVFTR